MMNSAYKLQISAPDFPPKEKLEEESSPRKDQKKEGTPGSPSTWNMQYSSVLFALLTCLFMVGTEYTPLISCPATQEGIPGYSKKRIHGCQ
jgi:hypothetical protein